MFRLGVRPELTLSSPCARNSGEIPSLATVSLRGTDAKFIAHLFPDGFGGFQPCLALHKTHARELGSFDNAGAMRFKHTPVVVKRYLS
jgi:hypothetical protein